ncbi:TnpV protein [Arthrobacter rhombi]|uniref:TnpV protein n=1 Tax=Arthrobacter rhombi TaxID=71253 RepID=UPI003FD146A8
MNRYGQFAQQAWQVRAPKEYAEIRDPETWFTDLGERADEIVEELSLKIAGPDTYGESYLHKVSRINAALMQAEEIVRAQMLIPKTSKCAATGSNGHAAESVLGSRQELTRFIRELGEELSAPDAGQGHEPQGRRVSGGDQRRVIGSASG